MKEKTTRSSRRKRESDRANKRAKLSTERRSKRSGGNRNLNLPRLQALFTLQKLSARLQSDVLSDGSVAKTFALTTSRSISLGPNVALPQEQLFARIREVLAGKKLGQLKNEKGTKLDIAITIQKDGTASIRSGDAVHALPFAGLLSPTPARRLSFLRGYLKVYTFASSTVTLLKKTLSQERFSDSDFLCAVEILNTGHENFSQNVRAAIRMRKLSPANLLPSNEQYWENLIGPCTASQSLVGFLSHERLKEVKRLLGANKTQAVQAISLSFCASALVPIDVLKNVPQKSLVKALWSLASLPDHFGLVGAFEVCTAMDLNQDIEALGVKLLDEITNFEGLEARCAFHAAMFVMTVAHLAEHEVLGKKPVFWRRITAAAHASLILRAYGPDEVKSVSDWAIRTFGRTFLFAILLEMDREPRWLPDWLTARHLFADSFGRVSQALEKIPEAKRPKTWVDRVASGQEWIATQQLNLLSFLPSIGESARKAKPLKKELQFAKPLYDKFIADPRIESLLHCAGAFYAIGVTSEIVKACRKLAEQLQKDDLRWTDRNVQYGVRILAFVVIQSRDTKLADLVAGFCVGKMREIRNDGSTVEIVCRLIECASADADRDKALKAFARRLEAVAFLAPTESLPDLCDAILRLQSIDARLAPELGKALAIARLG